MSIQGRPSDSLAGQKQMRRNDLINQPSDVHNQAQSNFLQETGTHVANMAQGAAEIGKGTAQGAVSLAKGAALGAANVAQGAAESIKNTFDMNTPSADTTMNHPNLAMDGSSYPSNTNHPRPKQT